VALAIELALCLALIAGLAVRPAHNASEAIKAFDVVPPAPPPVAPPPPKRQPAHTSARGDPSPPNLRRQATEIVAPPPVIPLPPPPIIAAPVAGTGGAPSQGAAPVAGPGYGAGGEGNGRGGGGSGDGSGDRSRETPPHRIKGRLSDRDYPGGAAAMGAGGSVVVRYVVAVTGRATNCTVTRTSGNAELDDTTCRLIEQRFRFAPSRDAQGRPVESMIVENHNWAIEEDPDRPPQR
ncbi:MAG: TonB family protein, partial [Sphingomonas sp.]